MRILVLSNLYPPLHLGGYELGCRDVVDGLADAGHVVKVLTSWHGLEGPRADAGVVRGLTYWPDHAASSWGALIRAEWKNRRSLKSLVRDFRPQVILVFSLYGVSHGLVVSAERSGVPVAYLFSAEWLEPGYRGDPWVERWAGRPTDAPRAWMKNALRAWCDRVVPTGLDPPSLRHSCFTSARLRSLHAAKGFPVADAPVIYWGVNPSRFGPPPAAGAGKAIRLLFAGRIAPEKGLDTAVEAVGLLRASRETAVTLEVVGPTQDAGYLTTIRERIAVLGIADRVSFLGMRPREDMPKIYGAHDVLVFPSIWEEPFSIGLLEAMASGLAVVGTTTGGSREILRDGTNALTFAPGDAAGLAAQLRKLANPDVRRRIGGAARETVQERFTLAIMLERMQAFLSQVAGGRVAVRRGS